MPFATSVSWPVTSNNATALTIAWSGGRSASWREKSTYEPDQRRVETGQTSPAAKSLRRSAQRPGATGGLCGAPELLSPRRGGVAGDRGTELLRLVFFAVVAQPKPTPGRRRCREQREGPVPGGGPSPAAGVAAQIHHPRQHEHCGADQFRAAAERVRGRGQSPARGNQRAGLSPSEQRPGSGAHE